jgi:hydrogenase maturation factor
MPDREPLPVGKLKMEALDPLLATLGRADASVIEGPGVGHDVAILDHGGPTLLVAKTDPITFATDALGYYAVAVNGNDIATCGGRPRWMLVTVLLPAGKADAALARDIFTQLADACSHFDITLVGGHTEVTAGLDRPILVASMLGEVERGRYVTPAGARPGDVVLVTKSVAVEGTSLIAREMRTDLLARGFDAPFLDRCAAMLHDPGISVVREAAAAVAAGGVHAMHDPTEGGVATALWELAVASFVRIVADPAAVPVMPECRRLCTEYAVDALGLIASGSLLIACEPEAADAISAAVTAEAIPCTSIGRIADALSVRAGGGEVVDLSGVPWPRYDQDELTRIL